MTTKRRPSGHMKLYGYQPATPLSASGCVHHWLCDPPNGGPVFGRCKYCGAEREFRETDDSDWQERSRAGGRARAMANRKERA